MYTLAIKYHYCIHTAHAAGRLPTYHEWDGSLAVPASRVDWFVFNELIFVLHCIQTTVNCLNFDLWFGY